MSSNGDRSLNLTHTDPPSLTHFKAQCLKTPWGDSHVMGPSLKLTTHCEPYY